MSLTMVERLSMGVAWNGAIRGAAAGIVGGTCRILGG